MIIDTIVSVLIMHPDGSPGLIVSALDLILPAGTPLGFSVPTGVLHGYSWIDSILPVHEALSVLLIMLGLTGVVAGFRLVEKLYHMIPFIG